MPKITKNLNYTEVRYGNLKIPLRFRNLVPPPSRLVTVVDDADGEKFFCHMHRQQPGRIDGLTKLYRKHRSSAVIIEINEREPKTVHIYCKAVSKNLLSQHDSEEYLIGRIPYRMESLRLCYSVCGRNLKPHPIHNLELRISQLLALDRDDLLENPIIESGLIYCRVLLEFLGIGLDHKTGRLKQKARLKKSTDISITDFGLSPLNVNHAIAGFSYALPAEVDAALRNVIETANKSVAHLTSASKLAADYPSLGLACRVVIDLVNRYLYAALGRDSLVPSI